MTEVRALLAPLVVVETPDVLIWSPGLMSIGARLTFCLQAYATNPSGLVHFEPDGERSLHLPEGKPRVSISAGPRGEERPHPLSSTGAGNERGAVWFFVSEWDLQQGAEANHIELHVSLPSFDVVLKREMEANHDPGP